MIEDMRQFLTALSDSELQTIEDGLNTFISEPAGNLLRTMLKDWAREAQAFVNAGPIYPDSVHEKNFKLGQLTVCARLLEKKGFGLLDEIQAAKQQNRKP